MLGRISRTETLFVIVTIFLAYVIEIGGSDDAAVYERISRNFIRVRGMKMDEYNLWWLPLSLESCYVKCLQETSFYCRSFCYSTEAEACSLYENARDTAPSVYYNPPGFIPEDPYGHVAWDYFELKSENYRKMEEEMDRLKNLTEISVEDASAVLGNVANLVKPVGDSPPPSSSGEEELENTPTAILPSELEIAGDSLLKVIGLNPIANTTLDGVKAFTKVIANVSSVMIDSSYASAWKMVQKDPLATGSAGIVTTAEVLCREASQHLLADKNSTNTITAESESVAFWLDLIESDPLEDDGPLLRSSDASQRSSHISSDENIHASILDQSSSSSASSSSYVFPQEEKDTEKVRSTTRGSTTTEPQQTSETYSTTLPIADDFLSDVISLPRKALGRRSVVINVRYKNLNQAMPTRKNDDSSLSEQESVRQNTLNSAVLTTTVIPRPPDDVFKREPVIIVFRHARAARGNVTGLDSEVPQVNVTTTEPSSPVIQHSEESAHCVYWDADSSENKAGAWSTKGCSVLESNATHTTCNCTHLTSFAVLLQIVDYKMDDEQIKGHEEALSIISKVGCGLSFVGVFLMCAAFIKLKFHTENMKIHFNLGVAVGVADLVFLFEELAEGSNAGCVAVTICLYYFNMSILAWMLIEGVHLYSQVVIVFVSARRWVKYYILIGWGAPLAIMAISMGILNVKLGKNEVCWLSARDNSIWAFAAPALLVLLVNTVILATVVRVIVKLQPEKSNSVKVAKFRNAVKGSIFLFPLLGTTWLFGFLCLSESTLVFQYIFAITNSLQGFFLFVFHCLCNSEIREDAKRHKWFSSSGSKRTGGQAVQSGVFGLNVASGIRRFRNSVSFELPSSSFVSSSEQSSETVDVEKMKVRRLRKITNLFPKIFSERLPKTIREEVEKYSTDYDATTTTSLSTRGTPTMRNTSSTSSPKEGQRSIPLPGMPTKNDRIISGSPARVRLPKEAQMKLDIMLADQIAKNMEQNGEDREQDGKISEDGVGIMEQGKETEEERIRMSYDSGLNSIDNESLLDESDDVWMASLLDRQKTKTEEGNDVTPDTEATATSRASA